MADQPLFEKASPYMEDVLALPVQDIDTAARWYSECFGLTKVGWQDAPCKTVLTERDGVRLGFAENGGDSSQDGAAILVTDITRARDEVNRNGVATDNWRVDERDGQKLQVFFVVAPDGLCWYSHQPIIE
jgi:predicted enzyme related to lactoylglutathione lyase